MIGACSRSRLNNFYFRQKKKEELKKVGEECLEENCL